VVISRLGPNQKTKGELISCEFALNRLLNRVFNSTLVFCEYGGIKAAVLSQLDSFFISSCFCLTAADV
jgi:hypothetical protein